MHITRLANRPLLRSRSHLWHVPEVPVEAP